LTTNKAPPHLSSATMWAGTLVAAQASVAPIERQSRIAAQIIDLSQQCEMMPISMTQRLLNGLLDHSAKLSRRHAKIKATQDPCRLECNPSRGEGARLS